MRRTLLTLTAAVALGLAIAPGTANADTSEDARLQRALERLVAADGGPPGAIAVVQRGSDRRVYSSGQADLRTKEGWRLQDHMRIASVAKAFSGATALALVERGTLSLDDTIGRLLPGLPQAWHGVTLGQLLNHTSGLPDYTKSEGIARLVTRTPRKIVPPLELIGFVADRPLVFIPGTRYSYSNTDNIVVALMVEAVSGRSYSDELDRLVLGPWGLGSTSLPFGAALPRPRANGYQLEEDNSPLDVTTLVAQAASWASGGIQSTPRDLNRFIRSYAAGRGLSSSAFDAQRRFIDGGGSEPPGPGHNSAGLALFRYQTKCGTVYGHTGNTFGYTQFASASANGQRSAVVSINIQLTQNSGDLAAFKRLRHTNGLAVCAALAD